MVFRRAVLLLHLVCYFGLLLLVSGVMVVIALCLLTLVLFVFELVYVGGFGYLLLVCVLYGGCWLLCFCLWCFSVVYCF